ncbi:nucleoside phosphorylase [Pseudoclostridium thermosuccinogenes]|uniref:5'-methylthioadenosine/S-adenosylhomocysteine nucleosidase family protein n=1 Tax=Clostridium thermosuccinogenes TaxID=84032 RepID=UPI002FD9F841
MVLIVTALMIEAAPIIEHFRLKKDMAIHEFPVYRNSDIALIVSGVGKVKSAMASAYLYSIYGKKEEDILVNIGFCGAGSSRYPPGTMLLINKITDMDTGRDYYPDVFFGQDMPKESVRCYSKPVMREDVGENIDIFCDMESSGIMEAANKFVYSHNVAILKIVSDYLNPQNLDKEQLKGLVRNQVPQVERIIGQLKQLNESSGDLSLSSEEREGVEAFSDRMKFSKAMKQMLLKEMKYAKLRGKEPLKVLESFMDIKVESRVEGKKVLEQIRQKIK